MLYVCFCFFLLKSELCHKLQISQNLKLRLLCYNQLFFLQIYNFKINVELFIYLFIFKVSKVLKKILKKKQILMQNCKFHKINFYLTNHDF